MGVSATLRRTVSPGDWMNQGKLVFAQVMEHLPLTTFRRCVARYSGKHIERAGGRFVTVLPRSRLEDTEFPKWPQTHSAPWEPVWDRPNPRVRHGPRDRWSLYRAALPSAPRAGR